MQFIALIIFCLSVLGIIFILFKKAPALAKLPQNGSAFHKGGFILKIENKINDIYLAFKKQIFLHKFLSWIKVITLKVETKTDALLHKIRKEAQNIDRDIKNKR